MRAPRGGGNLGGLLEVADPRSRACARVRPGLPRPRALPPGAAPPAAPRQPCTGHICCSEPARTPPPGSVPMETAGRGSCRLWPSDWFPLEPACFPRGLPLKVGAPPHPDRGFFLHLPSAGLSCARRPGGLGLPILTGIPPWGECLEPCPGPRGGSRPNRLRPRLLSHRASSCLGSDAGPELGTPGSHSSCAGGQRGTPKGPLPLPGPQFAPL